MKRTMVLATLLFTAAFAFGEREEQIAHAGQGSSPEFGYCYRDSQCGGGLLGYTTPDQCRSIYGKSWQSQTDNSCRAL